MVVESILDCFLYSQLPIRILGAGGRREHANKPFCREKIHIRLHINKRHFRAHWYTKNSWDRKKLQNESVYQAAKKIIIGWPRWKQEIAEND